MNIALFGATGMVGQRILAEALQRGHNVTVIVRDPARFTIAHQNLKVVPGDATDADSVAKTVAGTDVVVSALGPSPSGSPENLLKLTRSLIDGVDRSGVRRLIAVGGAGSLEVAPGLQLMDTPEFPAGWKEIAGAHRDALEIYKTANNLDWTNVSPAAFISPGQRTGSYRTGTDQLITDEKGESRISAEDFAIAILDEVENPRFKRQRFGVAY
ncbi:NAD(P)-dependent oxidoreductase [Dictyobacter kobayashii]|uniref:NAD(P)-binding domain-containing protein n=1 Tax=Dictyobacter kobayashii TaxID=2014872 RepID=A0A402AQ96_9CHLR|nr:NAD(P)-dependent oxidoreductase [Dictyobacter kobayashii]GCE21333.1 hypothetical protein KDK_51330 [Dictyobacter kobayashii]